MDFSSIIKFLSFNHSILSIRTQIFLLTSGTLLTVTALMYLIRKNHSDQNVDEKIESKIVRYFKTSVLKIAYCIQPRIDILNKIKNHTGVSIEIEKRTLKLMKDPINYNKLGSFVLIGTPQAIKEAEHKLANQLNELVTFSSKLHHSSVKYFKGKQGRRIIDLKSTIGSLIKIEAIPSHKYIPSSSGKDQEYIMFVVGTHSEVNRTKNEIDEIIYNQRCSNFDFKNFCIKNKENLVTVRTLPIKNENDFDISKEWMKLSKIFKIVDILSLTDHQGFINVWVMSFIDPSFFWVQPCTFEPTNIELDNLSDSISFEKDFQIQANTMVAVPLNDTNVYVRGYLLSLIKDKNSRILYVDHGGTKIIENSLIKQLSNEYENIEWQAVPCKLADIQPLDKTWSQLAISSFADMSYSGLFIPSKLKIRQFISQSSIYLVDLIVKGNNDNTDEIDMAQYLILQNYAISSKFSKINVQKNQKKRNYKLKPNF